MGVSIEPGGPRPPTRARSGWEHAAPQHPAARDGFPDTLDLGEERASAALGDGTACHQLARGPRRLPGHAARGVRVAPRQPEQRPPGGRVARREVPAEPHLVAGGGEQRQRPRGNRLARAREASLAPAEGTREAPGPATLRGDRQARRSPRATGPRIEEASVTHATRPRPAVRIALAAPAIGDVDAAGHGVQRIVRAGVVVVAAFLLEWVQRAAETLVARLDDAVAALRAANGWLDGLRAQRRRSLTGWPEDIDE